MIAIARRATAAALILQALTAIACDSVPLNKPAVSTIRVASPEPVSDSEGAETSEDDTALRFNLVAEIETPLAIVPLGSDAVVLAGHRFSRVPFLIEDNQLRYVPELDQFTHLPSDVLTLGGVWPDDAWLAVNGSSDAGPCSATLYKWRPASPASPGGISQDAGWQLEYELEICAQELLSFRGQTIILGRYFAVAVMTELDLRAMSKTRIERVHTDSCHGTSSSFPSRVRPNALTVFGYRCGPMGQWPPEGGAFLAETWDGAGDWTRQEFPVDGEEFVEHVVIDQERVHVLTPPDESGLRRLVPVHAPSRGPVLTLLPDFVRVDSPGSPALWGVQGETLKRWSNARWRSYDLPPELGTEAGARARVQSVWQRSEDDLWLIATRRGSAPDSPTRYLVFNTQDGKRETELPAEAGADIDFDAPPPPPKPCAHPFTDLVVRYPIESDRTPELSVEGARRLLSDAAARSPELAKLPLLAHNCYGQQCIGTHVTSEAQARKLRAAVHGDDFSVPLAAPLRCETPPRATPFERVAP